MKGPIDRQVAIDAVHEEFDECLVWDESGEYTADAVERILDRVPSAQPEIIHCKDCKYHDENEKNKATCWLPCMSMYKDDDWYCGSAERRTDE